MSQYGITQGGYNSRGDDDANGKYVANLAYGRPSVDHGTTTGRTPGNLTTSDVPIMDGNQTMTWMTWTQLTAQNVAANNKAWTDRHLAQPRKRYAERRRRDRRQAHPREEGPWTPQMPYEEKSMLIDGGNESLADAVSPLTHTYTHAYTHACAQGGGGGEGQSVMAEYGDASRAGDVVDANEFELKQPSDEYYGTAAFGPTEHEQFLAGVGGNMIMLPDQEMLSLNKFMEPLTKDERYGVAQEQAAMYQRLHDIFPENEGQ